jgi:23S rRNA (guanosine2251-2'-O)-methyltransferase
VPDGRTAPVDAEERDELIEPDAEVVAGRRPVEEAFAARREARRLIVVPQRRAALEALVLHATTLRIPVVEVEGGTLTSLAGFDGHQGVALVVAARAFATLEDVLARARELREPPFVLVLDSLEDPQNFGTLLRTAEAAGVHGVIYPTHHAAPLSPAAVKASAGAVEHLLLVPVDDLPGTITDTHGRGLRIIGAEANAPLAFRDADLRGPLALVVGSEGQGVSGAVRRRLDLAVSIPMTGRIASLNAAVAGSVLLVEAALQRGISRAPAATPDRASERETRSEGPATSETGESESGTSETGAASEAATSETGAPPEATSSETDAAADSPVATATPRKRPSRAGSTTASKPRQTRAGKRGAADAQTNEPEDSARVEPAAQLSSESSDGAGVTDELLPD